jgi:hypothetical protein
MNFFSRCYLNKARLTGTEVKTKNNLEMIMKYIDILTCLIFYNMY